MIIIMSSSGTNQQQSTFMDMVSKRLPRAEQWNKVALRLNLHKFMTN